MPITPRRSRTLLTAAVAVLTLTAAVAVLTLTGIRLGWLSPSPSPSPPSRAVMALPDTTNNIHLGLPFDTNITNPSAEVGAVDYVFASQWPNPPGHPLPVKTFYIPFDRELDTTYNPQAHTLSWFQANHPDWIEYRCDRKTVAYAFNQMTYVPLDMSNPAVQQYIERTDIVPALKGILPNARGLRYDGIAFDNLQMENGGSYSGQRCGHYNTSRVWVQQYTGTTDDPAYRANIIMWAKTMEAYIHTTFPGAVMSVNLSYDSAYPTDSATLLNAVDMIFDEQGMTNGNNAPPWDYADGQWLAKMIFMSSWLASGRAALDNNQEPVPFAQVTDAQTQWALANYALMKGSHCYFYMTGYQEYGYLYTRPEYAASIGSPVNSMYSAQNVYMRDFTNGKAIVNPSSSASYAISLPTRVYRDLYGNALNSVTLGPVSAIVLLDDPVPSHKHANSRLGRPAPERHVLVKQRAARPSNLSTGDMVEPPLP